MARSYVPARMQVRFISGHCLPAHVVSLFQIRLSSSRQSSKLIGRRAVRGKKMLLERSNVSIRTCCRPWADLPRWRGAVAGGLHGPPTRTRGPENSGIIYHTMQTSRTKIQNIWTTFAAWLSLGNSPSKCRNAQIIGLIRCGSNISSGPDRWTKQKNLV